MPRAKLRGDEPMTREPVSPQPASPPPDFPEDAPPDFPPGRPSAVRSYAMALGVGLLFVVAVLVVNQWRGEGDLLRLFGREDATWRAMTARGTWRVGMDPSFPPFQSLDDQGQVVGYDVDLARQIAAEWGLALEIVPLGFDSLLDALQAGRIDSVVSALPYDPRATRDIAYSPPYFEAGIRLATRADAALYAAWAESALAATGTPARAPGSSGAASTPVADDPAWLVQLADAQGGLRLAVEWGSMGDMVARRLHRGQPEIEVVPFETPADALAAVHEDATLDGVLMDNVALRLAQGEGAALVAIGPALAGNAYVIAMPVRANTLHSRLTGTLNGLIQAGMLEELEDRWFGAPPE